MRVTLSETSASVQPTMTRGMNKTGTSVPTKMHFAKKTAQTEGKSPKMIKTKKDKKTNKMKQKQ